MLRHWQVETGNLVESIDIVGHEPLNGTSAAATRLCDANVSVDGRLAATSGSSSHRVIVWDLKSGKPLQSFSIPSSFGSGLAFSADAGLLAAGYFMPSPAKNGVRVAPASGPNGGTSKLLSTCEPRRSISRQITGPCRWARRLQLADSRTRSVAILQNRFANVRSQQAAGRRLGRQKTAGWGRGWVSGDGGRCIYDRRAIQIGHGRHDDTAVNIRKNRSPDGLDPDPAVHHWRQALGTVAAAPRAAGNTMGIIISTNNPLNCAPVGPGWDRLTRSNSTGRGPFCDIRKSYEPLLNDSLIWRLANQQRWGDQHHSGPIYILHSFTCENSPDALNTRRNLLPSEWLSNFYRFGAACRTAKRSQGRTFTHMKP